MESLFPVINNSTATFGAVLDERPKKSLKMQSQILGSVCICSGDSLIIQLSTEPSAVQILIRIHGSILRQRVCFTHKRGGGEAMRAHLLPQIQTCNFYYELAASTA